MTRNLISDVQASLGFKDKGTTLLRLKLLAFVPDLLIEVSGTIGRKPRFYRGTTKDIEAWHDECLQTETLRNIKCRENGD